MSMKTWFKKMFGVPVLIEAPANKFDEPVGPVETTSWNDRGVCKLGIIVGHTKEIPGASLKGTDSIKEYHYNREVAQKAAALAKAKYPMLDVVVIYRDGIGIIGAYTEARKLLCDAVIELHFNAFNGEVSGTETYSSTEQGDAEFAHYVHKAVCFVFGRNGASRGVKAISKSTHGGINLYSFPGGVNCLSLPFFGDNLEEAKTGLRLSEEYAKGLLDGVCMWARQIDLLK